MQDILDLLLSNKLYMGIAVFVGFGLLIFLMKKIWKIKLLRQKKKEEIIIVNKKLIKIMERKIQKVIENV